MSGPKPKVKKIPPQLTPEQVAANESIKPGLGTSGFNPYPNKKKGHNLNNNMTKSSKTNKNMPEPLMVLDIKTMRQRPVSTAYLEQMANKLINWVNSKNKIIIDEFLQEVGYNYKTFSLFRNRCPKLEEAYQYAKMCIANRRERAGLYNKMNPSLVMKSLPDYSPRWKKLTKWHAELNKQNQNVVQGVQVVEIPAAEKTDIVKPLPHECVKKDKDE